MENGRNGEYTQKAPRAKFHGFVFWNLQGCKTWQFIERRKFKKHWRVNWPTKNQIWGKLRYQNLREVPNLSKNLANVQDFESFIFSRFFNLGWMFSYRFSPPSVLNDVASARERLLYLFYPMVVFTQNNVRWIKLDVCSRCFRKRDLK